MTISRFNLLLFSCLLPVLLGATSFFDLLYRGSDEAVALRLEVPMDSLLSKVRGKQEAAIIFTDPTGRVRKWKTAIQVRGKFRRQRCDYPPVKLNFKKKQLTAASLDEWDKYKLVSTCSADPMSVDLVLKEYLAYRVYNALTPNSFRVQRLRITYVDVNGAYPDRTEEGFIIEDTDEMAARLGGEEVDNAINRPVAEWDADAEATHALVQYLFSNGDFSMPLARNLKAVALPGGRLIPVGYDFDFSGWVGAPYASPTSEIGQKSIFQRVYQGYAQPDDVMRRVANRFKDKRREVLDMIANFRFLPTEERVITQRFAARFFRELNRMNTNNELPLYAQLRGAVAEYIPAGGAADQYRWTGK